MVRISCAVALALAALPASAQDSEVSKLREEVRRLQERVQDLDQQQKAKPPSQSGFNPEISVILQGTAANSSQDPDQYQITGFAPSGGEVAPARRGFSLSETELIFSANVDPYLRGQLVAALTPENEVEVEEAFFQTLGLGKGFSLKGGRFLSGIGYLNEIHQHAWDFQDAPLVYKAFLGGRFNDDGVQLRWVAPTDLFVELGAEAGRGRAFPGTDRNKSGSSAGSVFGHVGGDVGATGMARRCLLSRHVTRQPQLRRRRFARHARDAIVQRQEPPLDRRLRGAEVDCLQAAGRVLLAQGRRRARPSTPLVGRLRQPPIGLVCCRASTSSCRAGAPATATTA